jgi:hypothetical protein
MSLVTYKQGCPVKQLPDSWHTRLVWLDAIIFVTTFSISGALGSKGQWARQLLGVHSVSTGRALLQASMAVWSRGFQD